MNDFAPYQSFVLATCSRPTIAQIKKPCADCSVAGLVSVYDDLLVLFTYNYVLFVLPITDWHEAEAWVPDTPS
ncbi:MAG TPA: hypothetical protein VFJ47_00030 [Terriglobales bacterium]|nr:hypothetical protein [Terriglobales bacterium]